jgi:hypothetical protein
MKRFAKYLLVAVGIAGGCLLSAGYALSQTGYTNSLCSPFMICQNDGVCITEDGNCDVNFTQYKTTVFTTYMCSPFASYTCWLTPKNACVTTYYWNSPGCDIADQTCSQTVVSGNNCVNTGGGA